MKKIILKSYYYIRLGIIQVRLYVLINDFNFIEDDWNKDHIMKKISRLSTKQFYFLDKIEKL